MKKRFMNFIQLFNLSSTNRLKSYRKECKEDNKNVKVTVICPEEERMSDKLGISEKRKLELEAIILKVVKRNKYIPNAMEEISMECSHPNELAYCFYMLGAANQGPTLASMMQQGKGIQIRKDQLPPDVRRSLGLDDDE